MFVRKGFSLGPLDSIFSPNTVAVIGASEREGSVGRTVFWNLLKSPFGGLVYPVNPSRRNILGVRCYPSIGEIPDKVDLAVIATPAPSVPDIISECIAAGVRGAIIISAGFKEIGAEGTRLELEVHRRAQEGGMRIIGPNCLGVMNPLTGLNATFAASMAKPGGIAFFSQSGALCTAVLDRSLKTNLGFSAFVSVGSMVDVDWGDLISYFGDDPRTKSIVLYMETIGDARSFLSAAREVALTKPIICIKAGRTEAAAKAAASHTGSMAGSDKALDAALRRVGVLRVNTIAELFYMAEVFEKQPLPKGPKLTIVTNAGGPGVLAADSLIQAHGKLSTLSDSTVSQLSKVLPEQWSHSNPVDILGDADPMRYKKVLNTLAEDKDSDGILVILTPQDMTDPTETAEQIKSFAQVKNKPIFASWMGGEMVSAGESILRKAGIPIFPYPDTAARLFAYMWQHRQNLGALYETPKLLSDKWNHSSETDPVTTLIKDVRASGRTILTERESKVILAAYGIPTVQTITAHTEDDAVIAAEKVGYPVVLKLESETLTHKTDVGGVQLNLIDAHAVRDAFKSIKKSVTEIAGAEHFQGVSVQKMVRFRGYELILGSTADEQLGPVILFGSGGQLAEVLDDSSLGLPPLTSTLAQRMMERTRAYKALKSPRWGEPVNMDDLKNILVGFSQLVLNHREIKEIDINPLLASSEGLIALDARVILYPHDMDVESLPRPAIRPYPSQYISNWKTPDGQDVLIRPVMPEDEPMFVKFHETLSSETVYFRYFFLQKLSQRVAHDRLIRICFIDYDRSLALAAITNNAQGEKVIASVARITRTKNGDAEFAVIVADEFQSKKIGSHMMRTLLDVARKENVPRLTGTMLSENLRIQRLCKALGFSIKSGSEGTCEASIDLT